MFAALSDPVRRAILGQLDEHDRLVSELAAPFDISLQAVSKHIQVLVRAGLVTQERSGRISRCHLDAGPILDSDLDAIGKNGDSEQPITWTPGGSDGG